MTDITDTSDEHVEVIEDEKEITVNVDVDVEELQSDIKDLIEVIEDSIPEEEDEDPEDEKTLADLYDLIAEENVLTDDQEEEIKKNQLDEEGFRVDLLDSLGDVIEELEIINVTVDDTNVNTHKMVWGTNTILTYGIIYIPLAIVVFLLWRFFSTFLRVIR